ncbi:MAG: LacI family DNA-binding transcriptional regulator [Planctomycetes bacterium]|nr:LacI family DNA-binding transcriptional regulator [Planctomycetota bacterium]
MSRKTVTSKISGVTMKQIAERAGVSQPLVSVILRGDDKSGIRCGGDVRRRVLEAARRFRYRPSHAARSLLSGKHNAIGILVNQFGNVDKKYFSGISAAAWKSGQLIVLGPIPETESPEQHPCTPRILSEDVADGLIVLDDIPDSMSSEIDRIGLPAVWVNTNRRNGPGCITIDEEASIAAAVAHLVSLGRRCVGYVGPDESGHYSRAERLAAVRKAAAKMGLPEPPVLTLCEERKIVAKIGETDRLVAEFLAGRPGLDACVAYRDSIAPYVYRAARSLGRKIPENLAVIGADDTPHAIAVDPLLTTLRIPQRKMGARAVEILLAMINGEPIPKTPVRFTAELVVRNST